MAIILDCVVIPSQSETVKFRNTFYLICINQTSVLPKMLGYFGKVTFSCKCGSWFLFRSEMLFDDKRLFVSFLLVLPY